MNLLFTICGRAGSKGVKNKNLRDFCGVPLVWLTLAAVKLYEESYADEDKIITALSTDSEQLISCAESNPEVPLFIVRRSAELSGDRIAKQAVIRDCMEQAEAHYGLQFDMVIDLDITSPLRTVEHIRAAIEKKAARPEVDAVFSVVPARRSPYFNMVREKEGFFVKAIEADFVARQQAPELYDMNASIYAYSPSALWAKEPSIFFNDRADIILMPDTGILDIDSEEDYELMQEIASFLYRKSKDLKAAYKRASDWVKMST